MKNSDPLLLLYFIFLFLNLEVTYGTLSLRHEMRAFLWEKNMEISCKLLEHWPHWQYWRIENLQCCSLFFIWEKNFHPGFAFFLCFAVGLLQLLPICFIFIIWMGSGSVDQIIHNQESMWLVSRLRRRKWKSTPGTDRFEPEPETKWKFCCPISLILKTSWHPLLEWI